MIKIRYSNRSLVVVVHVNFTKKKDIVCAAVPGIVFRALS